MTLELPKEPAGRRRVVIENVRPSVDGGRWAAKHILGERLVVTADVFTDGHPEIHVVARLWRDGDKAHRATEITMEHLGNDVWAASFEPQELGRWWFDVTGWIDHFETWRKATAIKIEAGSATDVDFAIGAEILATAAERAKGKDSRRLAESAAALGSDARRDVIADDELAGLAARMDDREHQSRCDRPFPVDVDRERAGYGAWYEMFPRSASTTPGVHGTFADVVDRLDYVAGMGFDVLYLPPIHPIGRSYRKGPDNTLTATDEDVGSPWAIGSAQGGHTSVLPELGTLDDFRALLAAAADAGLEVALDIAFQCSPDHPWVIEHPQWFGHRPDGSIQYAENPPKKYQDIYPLDFDSDDWRALWIALKDVFEFWIAQGVRIFRVDNPHTKSFAFWEWCVAELRREHPEVILLSEAFTRPRVMERLAKLGFHQSYTYFAWRNSAWELREYFEELTGTELADYFRPNVWPNTPDILNDYLQHGGRNGFVVRAVLAATLAASYGVYGPAFELCEHEPIAPGSEEYRSSEKYQLRSWDLEDPRSIAPVLTRLNRIRAEHPALQTNRTLVFHGTDSDALLCYSKRSPDGSDVVLTVVNVDAHNMAEGHVELDLDALGLDWEDPFQTTDLLAGGTYTWQGSRNYVRLDPSVTPAHVLQLTPNAAGVQVSKAT